MAKVFIEEATLTGIADAIREKEGTTELIPPLEMPARIEALGGSGLALEEWMTSFSLSTLNVLRNAKATLNLNSATNLNNMVIRTNDHAGEYLNTTVEELTINCPNKVEGIRNLLGCSHLAPDYTLKKVIMNVDTSAIKAAGGAFANCRALVSIEGTPLDFTPLTAVNDVIYTFNSCLALIDVRFTGVIKININFANSSKFSKASIINVFSCLSTETTGLTLSLSKKAVNTAFEASEGAADGSTSAEWLALVEAHSNWTISLI